MWENFGKVISGRAAVSGNKVVSLLGVVSRHISQPDVFQVEKDHHHMSTKKKKKKIQEETASCEDE